MDDGKRETGNGKRETGNGKRETGNGKRRVASVLLSTPLRSTQRRRLRSSYFSRWSEADKLAPCCASRAFGKTLISIMSDACVRVLIRIRVDQWRRHSRLPAFGKSGIEITAVANPNYMRVHRIIVAID
jgi:hypothetical protein